MTREHHHHWYIESTHPTSEGTVTYQRCGCGERRVTLARIEDAGAVEARLSRW